MLALSKTETRLASMIVIALAFLFAFPDPVSAIPLSEYQQKIKQAVTVLDTLSEVVNEHEGESQFQKLLPQTIDAVRATLPEHLTVEANGEVYQVDNSSLYKTLEDLKSLSVEAQIKKIVDIKEMLQALEVRLEERISATASGENKEQAKRRLEGILARPEYANEPRESNALVRAIQDFFR